MPETIKLLVVDDHALFRRGIVSLLKEQPDFQVIGTADSGPTAVQLCQQEKPHVVLMDVHMPGGGGVDAVAALKQMLDVRVIMLTISNKDEDLLGALAAGADGYLLKSAEPDELCQAIRQVAAGKGVLSPEVTARVMRAAAAQTPATTSSLSQRELDVLQELARGATTADIAATLVISENTVKTHIRRIFKKLGVTNRTQAVAQAASQGLLPANQ
ncbi:MAG TPA: response regulator transcription factor [Anaerolineae bacterium]|nr:response regulator transcription factor [Anaerolineae bacterium]